MQILSLIESKKLVSYTYTKGTLGESFAPQMTPEESCAAVYTPENGNLFSGRPVRWKKNEMLNRRLHINLQLCDRFFVDHVTISQGELSGAASIEILTPENGGLKKIGRLSPVSGPTLTVPVGYFCRELTIRVNGNYDDFEIRGLEILAASFAKTEIFPIPQTVEWKDGAFSLSSLTRIGFDSAEAKAAALDLAARLEEVLGIKPSCAEGDGQIIFVHKDMPEDEYEISVTEEGCQLLAGNKRGFFYAAASLIQTIRDGAVPCGKVKDSPMMQIRGMHLALPNRDQIPFLKRIVRELLVPMRYNTVFIQLSGAMRYDNFPEINEGWLRDCAAYERGETPVPAHYYFVGHDILEKDEIADICAYIRSFGLEIVPEVQCLSHSQYITSAYPELVEPELREGEVHNDPAHPLPYHHPSICPGHPRYYEVVLGIIEEVIELIRPEKYLHIGHDECYYIANCPICSKKGGAAVLAEEINRLHEYITSKGLTVMMWGDMLQHQRYSLPDAIDMIPKDIVMLDFVWYFNLDRDIEDRLIEAGFPVMMGNLYSSHYPRYDTRARKKGMIGAQVSTWVECNERSYGYEGKFYDLVYSANAMWNKEFRSDARLSYSHQVDGLLWRLRRIFGDMALGEDTVSIDLGGSASAQNMPASLRFASDYDRALAVTPEKADAEIEVGLKAKAFSFVHATDIPSERLVWTPAIEMASYELIYEDGTSAVIPVGYGESIFHYAYRYGAPYASILYRHLGYTATYLAKPICGKDVYGDDYTLLDYPVNNPHPEKTVKSIAIKHNGNTDAGLLLFEIKAYR